MAKKRKKSKRATRGHRTSYARWYPPLNTLSKAIFVIQALKEQYMLVDKENRLLRGVAREVAKGNLAEAQAKLVAIEAACPWRAKITQKPYDVEFKSRVVRYALAAPHGKKAAVARYFGVETMRLVAWVKAHKAGKLKDSIGMNVPKAPAEKITLDDGTILDPEKAVVQFRQWFGFRRGTRKTVENILGDTYRGSIVAEPADQKRENDITSDMWDDI